MMSCPTHYYELPSPFATELGCLKLLEPPGASAQELRARLLDESYDKPFVLDDGELRYLYFNTRLMQSAMRLKTPDSLELRYTQKMMAFLLFHGRPRRLALIGLGGGSLLKFCYRRLPGTHLTAVELDAQVLALQSLFHLPPADARFALVQGEGAEWLATAEKGLDVLLIDAFNKEGFAPSLAHREFFQDAWDKLSGNGVLVVNLAGEPASYAGLVGTVMQVFDDQVLVVSVPEDGNHILYAFKARHFEPRWRVIHNLARELKARHGLDFPRFAEKLERASRQGVARRLLEGSLSCF